MAADVRLADRSGSRMAQAISFFIGFPLNAIVAADCYANPLARDTTPDLSRPRWSGAKGLRVTLRRKESSVTVIACPSRCDRSRFTGLRF
jgi:hypothetical protein